MPSPPAARALLLAAALLGGCSFADQTLFPGFSGENPRGLAAARAQGTATPEAAAPAAPGPATPGESRAAQLGRDLQRLQDEVAQRRTELADARGRLEELATRYAAAADGIEDRARHGDARVPAQRGEAEAQLARTGEEVGRLNALSAATARDATLASYIVQSASAALAQPGASDLRRLSEIGTAARVAGADADRLLVEIGGEIAEQSRTVSAERRRLAALGGIAAPQAAAASPRPGERRPLVTVHFPRPDAPFEQPLTAAVRQALQRRPDLGFDIVAVSPPGTDAATASTAAKRNMAGVVRTLAGMGVTPERLRLSATMDAAARDDEVRLYPR
jgi:hypothetical protein